MRMRSDVRLVAVAVLLILFAGGCSGGPEQIPAVTGDMDCAEVAEVVDAAIVRGGRFVAQQETDAMLSSELVFALSGAEERPECVTEAVRSRAAGLRATLVGTSG